jgi:excisionase family DNA binding protein
MNRTDYDVPRGKSIKPLWGLRCLGVSVFEEALQEFKKQILEELEERLWEKLESRIRTALHSRIMSVAETANYLHVSEPTVRRMISEKEIPFFRIRNQIFVPQLELDEWIQSQVKASKEQ